VLSISLLAAYSLKHTEIGKYANRNGTSSVCNNSTSFLRHIEKENFGYYWAASLILVEIEKARSSKIETCCENSLKMFVH
jgi:hypothetical protein